MSSPVSYSLMAQNINMEDFNRLIEALNEKMLIGFAFTDLTPFTEHDGEASLHRLPWPCKLEHLEG